MATRQYQYVCDNSSVANFNQWAGGISAAFAAFGWTKSSDTGQVATWGSVAVPAAGAYVYEIWTPTDAKQSTCPIYLKMEYGSGTAVVPQLRVTCGTGSTGAGALLNSGAAYVVPSAAGVNLGATQWDCDFSGTSSRFSVIMWRNASDAKMPWYLGIERSRDNSGVETDEYFTFTMCSYNAIKIQQTWSKTYGMDVAENNLLGILTTQTSGGFGLNTAVSPVFPLPGKLGNPMMGTLMCKGADVAEGAMLTANIYGSNHTYITTKAGAMSGIGTGSAALLMLWE